MADEYIVPNEQAWDRTSRVVRRAESALFGDDAGGWNREGGSYSHVLRVQAGASNSFGYPARIQTWSDSAGSWTDLDTTEVRVEDPNGTALASTQYVTARYLGVNSSAVGCFAATGLLSLSVADATTTVTGVTSITFSPDAAVTVGGSGGAATVALDYATYNDPGIISTANQFLGAGIKRAQVLGVSSYASVITGWWDDDGPSMVNLYGYGTTAGAASTLYVLGAVDPPVYPSTLSTEVTSGVYCKVLDLADVATSPTYHHTLYHYSDTTNRTEFYNGSSTAVSAVTYAALEVNSLDRFFSYTGTRAGVPSTKTGLLASILQADEFWYSTGTTYYRGLTGTFYGGAFGGGILTNGVTEVPLSGGGTGTSLSDPGADRLMFWDDSAGAVAWLAPDASLAISGTTMSVATVDGGTW